MYMPMDRPGFLAYKLVLQVSSLEVCIFQVLTYIGFPVLYEYVTNYDLLIAMYSVVEIVPDDMPPAYTYACIGNM